MSEKHPRLQLIREQFRKRFLFIMIVAFVATGVLTYVLQRGLSSALIETDIDNAIADVSGMVSDAAGTELIDAAYKLNATYSSRPTSAELVSWAESHNIFEINAVDKNGIIFASTEPDYVGFDMESGEQSAEFMVLLNGVETYDQPLRANVLDADVKRKYAGIATSYGFLQVGYSEETYWKFASENSKNLTANYHVGDNGYVLLCDAQGNLYSDAKENANYNRTANISEFSDIVLNEQMDEGMFGATVYGNRSYCKVARTGDDYIIAVASKEEVLFQARVMTAVTLLFEVLVFVVIFLQTRTLVHRLVIEDMRIVQQSLKRIAHGDLDVKADAHGTIDFVELSEHINMTVDTLKGHIEAEKKRIDDDLAFAATIQENALPGIFPPYPDRPEFEIFACMDPAKEVGGDFYDFFFTAHNYFVFLVADVSGKGIPGAMFMMQSKAVVKSLAEAKLDMDELFNRANEELCENNKAGMFVTMWMGILDLTNGVIHYANAGHNYPLLRRKGGTFEFVTERPNFVLAGMEGVKYKIHTLTMEPGDMLFLYTDGVPEATDRHNELFGDDRLIAAADLAMQKSAYIRRLAEERGVEPVDIEGNPRLDVKDLCDGITEAVWEFVGPAPQFDDMTMLALKYKGAPMVEELNIEATVENIAKVTEFVDTQLEAIDCPMKAQMQIDIAIDELFGNIAYYAYNPEVGPATVRVEVQKDPMAVIITFIDHGVPYDPLSAEDPDTTLSAEERSVGGLGVYMVKQTMDDVTYEYKDGQNILMIKKEL